MFDTYHIDNEYIIHIKMFIIVMLYNDVEKIITIL